MWLTAFLLILQIVGPIVLEAIVQWIKTLSAGKTLAFDAIPQEAPEMVRVHRKTHKVIASLLSNPKTRGARMAVMLDRCAKAKKALVA
jgi:hypothetical protein